MGFASSNRTAVRFVKESVFGTTPATPALKELRYTGESLNYNLSNITSDEINAERMTSDLVQVQSDASGDINFEFSHTTFDDLIDGAFCDTWSAELNLSGTDIEFIAADKSINATSTDLSSASIGQIIKTSGSTDNDGYHKVVTVTATKIVTVSTIVDESAGATVSIDGSMLRNGTSLQGYTIQKHVQDATTPIFLDFNGCAISGFSLNFETGQILNGGINVLSFGATSSESQITGATIEDASDNTPMNAVGNIIEIMDNDVAMTAKFQSLTFQLSNNVRAQDAIGSLQHVGLVLGRLEVTGNVGIYFEDSTMYDRYLNATGFSLSFRLQDIDGNAYILTMPNIKFETGAIVAGGVDQDMIFDASWRALRDETTSCMVQLDRFSA